MYSVAHVASRKIHFFIILKTFLQTPILPKRLVVSKTLLHLHVKIIFMTNYATNNFFWSLVNNCYVPFPFFNEFFSPKSYKIKN